MTVEQPVLGRTDWNRAEYDVDEPKRSMSEIIRGLLDESHAKDDARRAEGLDPRAALIYCPICETDYYRCEFTAHVGSIDCGQTLIDRKVYDLVGRAGRE